MRIVDDAGAILPPGVEGEIELSGRSSASATSTPRSTRRRSPPTASCARATSAVIDAEGFVRITGRKKDIIIRKGENLSAKAIEDVLYEHPEVADAAVIGVPDAASGERVCACWSCARGRRR